MPWKLSHEALGHTALYPNRPPVPLGHSRDGQHEPSRTDRTERGPMWPWVPGEYSRREDVGLAPESAAPGPDASCPDPRAVLTRRHHSFP